jgi:hypothetical protein
MTCAATPSGFATRPVRRQRDVDVARFLDRLAGVHRLEDGELAAALLEDPRDPEQVLGALLPRQVAPAGLLGPSSGANGPVDVRRRGLGDLRDDLLGRRVDALEDPTV